MELLWVIGLLLLVVATILAVLLVQKALRPEKPATTKEGTDLFLADVGEARPVPRRRPPEFIEDTAPAVLSVPPELDRPEWEQQPKRPSNQKWLH